LRYPVVFMDVGGTLIGPRVSFGETYAEVFEEFGVRCDGARFNDAVHATWNEMNRMIPAGADRYSHFENGENGYWCRFVQRAVELATGEIIGDRLTIEALRLLLDRFGSADVWRVFDDVEPALETLRGQGIRLAVVSNWDSRLDNVLNVLGLDGWFETVVVSHLEGVEKPDAEIFNRALERMRIAPSEALHVGDSPELDGVGAQAAGVDWIWVDRRDPKNAKAVPSFDSLPQIVERGLTESS